MKYKKVKIKSHAVGLTGIAGFLSNNPQAIGLGAQFIPQLTSTLGMSEDASTVINDTASMAATGASFGPIGAGVGGLLGLGKGLLGIQANKKRRQKIRNAKNRVENVQALSRLNAQSEEMASDYYSENENIPTFANGISNSNSSLAFLDDQEIVKTPSKKLIKINGNPNIKDNVLTNLPNGSSVLSDMIINPFTNNTFAKDGEKFRKISNRKYGNYDTKLSRSTKELNDKYVDRKTNELINIQDVVKKITNNDQQDYKNIPAYATGLKGSGGLGKRIARIGTNSPGNSSNNIQLETQYLPVVPSIDPANVKITNPLNSTTTQQKNTIDNNFSSNNILNGLSNILTDFAATAPIRNNMELYNEGPEVEPIVTNPYNNQINTLMRARRIKNRTLRDNINRQRGISRYNSRNITNTGANMAYNIAADASANALELEGLNQIQQVNNNYVGEYANTLNNLGQQYSSARTYANDINARNRAANRNAKSTAMTQLGQFAQNKQLMRNQANRDNGLLEALTPFLKEGFDSNVLNNLLAQFK